MLSLNLVKAGMLIAVDGIPYEVIKAEHAKQGRGGAILRTTLKNVLTGAQLDQTFRGDEKLEPATIMDHPAQFIYADGEHLVFMDTASYEQFHLDKATVGQAIHFLLPESRVEVSRYEGKPIAVKLPMKLRMKVTEAPPGVKGDTANNPSKEITLETGLKIKAPMFIATGDEIIVDTRTATYVEKAK